MTIGESLIYSQMVEPYVPDMQMSVIPIPLNIRAGGNYAQLLDFLRQIMGVDRLMMIDNITMVPETVTSSTTKYPLTMSVSGSIYYLGNTKLLTPYIKTLDIPKK